MPPLVLDGRVIPGWETIRDVIGRGSASTINNARKAYLENQARQLRAAAEIPGVPEGIQEAMRSLWESAVATAKKAHESELLVVSNERDLLNSKVETLVAERLDLQTSIDEIKGQRSDLARSLAASESANEKLQSDFRDISQQNAQLAIELEKVQQLRQEEKQALQTQIDKITASFEGLEKHALKEIDRARTEAKKSVEAAEAAKLQAIERIKTDVTRMETHFRNQVQEIADRLRVSDADNRSLQEKINQLNREIGAVDSERHALTTEVSRRVNTIEGLEESLRSATCYCRNKSAIICRRFFG